MTPQRAGQLLLVIALALPVPARFASAQGHPATPVPTPATQAGGRGMGGPGRAHVPGQVAISPDGTVVAWTLQGANGSELRLTSLSPADTVQDGTPQRVLAPDTFDNPANSKASICPASNPVWSPDGKELAFLSTCSTPASANPKDWETGQQTNIFVWTSATNTMQQVSHVHGSIAQLAWSPDGKTIAFLFVENATRTAGALDAMKPWSGVIGEDGVEIQRVYGINVASGKGGWLTPGNLHVYEFSWAPTSDEIAFMGAPPPGENNWWVAKLYTTSRAADGNDKAVRVVLDPEAIPGPLHGLQIAVPRWSPDGKRISLIGGLMSDQGSTGGDVWVVDAKGGEPIDVTPNIDGTPCFETWLDNDRIAMVEDRSGHTVLPDYDVSRRAPISGDAIDLGEVAVSGGPAKDAISSSRSGVFAFVKSGITSPPEIWVGRLDSLHQLTHLNDGAKPSAKVESIEWDNEGFHIQGWLTYPKDYDPAKKYPLIVSVHGGPSSSAGPRWGNSTWSALGYFEFAPNPRGSFGQGEKFVQANRKDFGYGDLRDILKGMDAVEAKVSIDKNREGITGWSYGGYMTMFAVTQTHRFRAAVAGAGVSDWLSYYGENSIDQWMIPFFGASVYDDPAVYAKSAPITFIKNVKTPTLVLVGDRDGECPAPQSFEFWHALRDEGVKTQLVVYPDEGHGFRNPEHIRDRSEREAKWFADNMPAE